MEHFGPIPSPDRPDLAHTTSQICAGTRHGLRRELQAQRRVERIVGIIHPVLDQLLRHLGSVAGGTVRRGDSILQRPRVVQLLDLLHQKLVRMLNVQLEADGMKDDSLEEEDPLLELDEFFRLAVEQSLPIIAATTTLAAAGRGRPRRRRETASVRRTGRQPPDTAGTRTLAGRPRLSRRPILQPMAFLDHQRQLLRTFLRLGRQEQARHGHLEPIVLGEAVLGVEAVEEHHAGGDRDAGKAKEAATLLQKSARPATLLAFLRRANAILYDRGKLRFVECLRHSFGWRRRTGRRRWPTSRRWTRWRGVSRMWLRHGSGGIGPREACVRPPMPPIRTGHVQKCVRGRGRRRHFAMLLAT